jgi:DNA-binding CsgD family transcriptional regulator
MPAVAGRDVELTSLGEVLGDLRTGRGRAVLVEGEAGIGKSSLVSTALAAGAGRTRVLAGVCDELTQRFPLSVVRQTLGRALSVPPKAVGGDDPVQAAVEELLGAVQGLCAEGPLVLVLEDLHWADEASILWWRRLCRLTSQLPLVLIGTRRLIPQPPGVDSLVRQVHAEGGVLLPLEGLEPDTVRAMAADLVDGTPGPRLLHRLGQAGGNPFYVRELIDEAVRREALRTTGGVTDLVEDIERAGPAGAAFREDPALLRAAVASRLDFMPDDALRVLRIAALLGPEFEASDLAAVCEQTTAALLPVLEDAFAAGVLEESGHRLRFRHGLLQQALYDGTAAPLRAALHQQAARTLARLEAPADRVARQLLAVPAEIAGGAGWEVSWLADQAPELVRQVPEVAAELLQRVLRQARPDAAGRCQLEDELLEAQFTLHRYEQTERLAREVLRSVSDPDRYGRVTWLLGYALQRLRRHADAEQTLAVASERAGLSAVWRARFTALRAMVNRSLGGSAQARQYASAALEAGRALGDAQAIAYALHALAVQHNDDRDLRGACRLIDEALPVAEGDPRLGDLFVMLAYNRVSFGGELEELEEGRKLALNVLNRDELAGSPRLRRLHGLIAGIAYQTGRWDETMAELDDSSETSVDDHLDDSPYLRVLIRAHRDEWPAVQDELAALKRSTEGYAPPSRPKRHLAADIAAVSVLDIERSGEPQAAATLLRWLEPGREDVAPYLQPVLPDFVRLLLASGDEPGARAAAEAAGREAQRDPRRRKLAVGQWCQGVIDADPAAVLSAAGTMRELGLPLPAGSAFEDAAVLLAQAEAAARARAALRDALALYGQLGADWDARRAVSRVRPFGIRPGARGPRRRPQTGWEALTRTERQVADLVAAGHSNPDIAAVLFISRRTVESHVSRILVKLQVTSRWGVRTTADQAGRQ